MREAILAMLMAFALSTIACPLFIPVLRRLKFGQSEREDGPESHLKKAGTPTMGGVAFLLAILITGIVFSFWYEKIRPVLIVTMGYGLVGFGDDYLKVVKKNTDGLSPIMKMGGQFIITTGLLIYMMYVAEDGTQIRIPFTNGYMWDMSWLYIPFVYLVMLATDNGVNFSDGVDGLCSSVTAVVAAFFALVSIQLDLGVSPICGAVIGALLGFLISNLHPAKVFMGDTGSLALGGFVGAIALVEKIPLLILVVGVIYAAELLSVVIQVSYFKATHGKRVFRMAPIHHHYELGGWSETKVVGVFTIVTILGAAVAWLIM